jgi:hypothetical protein
MSCSVPVTAGKHKIRDARREALEHAAIALANTIATGHGLFAARRALERAAVQYRDAVLAVEMGRGE